MADFTGVSAPFEVPECPDLVIDTSVVAVTDALEQLVDQVLVAVD